MNKTAEVSAAFALRLVVDILTALTVTGTLSKKAASALIYDSLNAMLESHPDQARIVREIAATLTAQTGLASVALKRLLDRG